MASINDFVGKRILIKYGGAAMEDPATRQAVCAEVAELHRLGVKVIVVHGGGKEISRMMERVGLTPRFINGLRVTDQGAMEITEMVLSGAINSDLSSRISRAGAPAIGLSGRDARIIQAVPLRGKNGEDMGQTGEVRSISAAAVEAVLSTNFVPVISPVGEDDEGRPLNLNADYAAGALAGSLGVEACVFLTDVAGVKKNEAVLPRLTHAEITTLINEGTISGGMIPKVECATKAIAAGCSRAIICQAARPNVLRDTLSGLLDSGTSIVA